MRIRNRLPCLIGAAPLLIGAACGNSGECGSGSQCIAVATVLIDECPEQQDACVLDFGTLSATTQKTVHFSNPTSVDADFGCAISTDAGEPVTFVLVNPVPTSVAAGAHVAVTVEADPTGAGEARSQLNLTSTASNFPNGAFSISLSATAASP